MSVNASKPACSSWSLWEGPEVEGESGIGTRTLFVRDAFASLVLELLCKSTLTPNPFKRVWLCEDYRPNSLAAVLGMLTNSFWFHAVKDSVIAFSSAAPNQREWDFLDYREKIVTDEVAARMVLYIKRKPAKDALRKGDHVCVGQPYSEYIFPLYTPSVSPADYGSDIFIA